MGNRYALEPGARAMLVDMGMSPTAVLRRAGLRSDLLSNGPVWLAPDEIFSLWRAIEIEANHPNLPILIVETLSPDVFAPALFAAVVSPDLNTAARRVAQYKQLVGPLQMTVEIGQDQTTLGFDWPVGAQPPESMVLTELLFWVGLARLGTRAEVTPTRVTVPTPPTDLDAYPTREKLARHYLGNPSLSGADIAFLLGYGDTSSFYRAFQTWTGQTPEQARSSLTRA